LNATVKGHTQSIHTQTLLRGGEVNLVSRSYCSDSSLKSVGCRFW